MFLVILFVGELFSCFGMGVHSAFVHNAIALAEHDDAGLPPLDPSFADMGETHNRKQVALFPWKAAAPLSTIWPEPGSLGMA